MIIVCETNRGGFCGNFRKNWKLRLGKYSWDFSHGSDSRIHLQVKRDSFTPCVAGVLANTYTKNRTYQLAPEFRSMYYLRAIPSICWFVLMQRPFSTVKNKLWACLKYRKEMDWESRAKGTFQWVRGNFQPPARFDESRSTQRLKGDIRRACVSIQFWTYLISPIWLSRLLNLLWKLISAYV